MYHTSYDAIVKLSIYKPKLSPHRFHFSFVFVHLTNLVINSQNSHFPFLFFTCYFFVLVLNQRLEIRDLLLKCTQGKLLTQLFERRLILQNYLQAAESQQSKKI